ncbi:hypothetical protein CGSSp9BS68_02958, partial [Streptococcus pneumoniae SP9-BS68]
LLGGSFVFFLFIGFFEERHFLVFVN